MEINIAAPNNIGWVQSKLDKIHIDYLWKIIEEGKKKNLSFKEELAGHVSNSFEITDTCLLYTSPSPRDLSTSRMPSSA